jgi:DNA-binding transcriptional MerR regulator
VSRITGVKTGTLRIWESRYGLITPVRTDSGHRLYSDADVRTVHDILRLLEQDIPVSQVKKHLDIQTREQKLRTDPGNVWNNWFNQSLNAIVYFDERRLDRVYNQALSNYSRQTVTDNLILPLLDHLGAQWERSRTGIAEEHFFTLYFRNKLGAQFHHRQPFDTGKRLLTACLPGEHHETGLLLFALHAHDQGFRPVMLGANTPLPEVQRICKSRGFDAVVLSGTTVDNEQQLREELAHLVSNSRIPVFVGGACSLNNAETMAGAGAIPLGIDSEQGIVTIQKTLARSTSADEPAVRRVATTV